MKPVSPPTGDCGGPWNCSFVLQAFVPQWHKHDTHLHNDRLVPSLAHLKQNKRNFFTRSHGQGSPGLWNLKETEAKGKKLHLPKYRKSTWDIFFSFVDSPKPFKTAFFCPVSSIMISAPLLSLNLILLKIAICPSFPLPPFSSSPTGRGADSMVGLLGLTTSTKDLISPGNKKHTGVGDESTHASASTEKQPNT